MEQNIYEQKSLTKLIFIFGIPSILSLMIEMLTGVVDTAFAGNLAGIGGSALSAMALLSPLLTIFTALQTLFAISTGILIAKYLNHAEQQNKSYATGIIMSLLVATCTSLICYFSLTNILTMLGAEGEIFGLARQYLQIQLFSNIVSSIGYTLTCCIRAFGFPKIEVVIICGAVIVNIICNYIFAYLLNMGISGLALGTLVSEIICAICAVLFLLNKRLLPQKKGLSFTCFMHSTWELFKIGVAQTVIQMLVGCTGLVMNARLLSLGTMTHVAAWNVVLRIYTLTLMPIVGLTQGVQSIIAYFSGNNKQNKIKQVSKKTMLFCSGYGIFAMMIMMLFAGNFAGVFGGSLEIASIAQVVLRIVFIGFPFIGVLYTDMTLLQVTGHEVASVLLILSRQVLFLIPLVYIVPYFASLANWNVSPIMALFFSMPIADLLSVIFGLAVKKRVGDKRN